MRGLAVALLAAVLAACAGSAPRTAEAPFALDSFRWRDDATPQGIVLATNDWGDLRVRTADRGGLVVSAMIQRIGTAREELEIRIEETAEVVVVEVVPLVARPRGRVDLTLMVPPGKRLEGTTRDGLAEIKYRGDVLAQTRGGDILIETAGHASARSKSGSITARLFGEAWRHPLSFTSGSGDVTLWLPEDANPELRVESAHGDVRVIPYRTRPPQLSADSRSCQGMR